MSADLFFIISVSLFGLLLGSFANAAIYRIPRDIPLGLFTHRRSQCPKCGTQIKAVHNIPLISYLWLKGRCASCAAQIPLRYLLVELMGLVVFFSSAILYLQFRGFSWGYDGIVWELGSFFVQLYFIWSLLVVTFIDLDFRIIPDRFSLGNWGVALAAALLFGEPYIVNSLIGGLVGFGIFYALAWGYERAKGVEGLGFGDVKMMGWLGAWLGFEWVPFTILVASLSGLVIGLIVARKSGEGLQSALPFGPFLALAALIAWVMKISAFSLEALVF